MRHSVPAETAAVIGLSALALTLRLWNLGSVPYGPLGDEASYALRAMMIANGAHIGIWNPDTLGVPSGHVWLMALFFKIGEPSLFTARLLSALVGTLLTPMCFYTLRMHYSFRVAFAGAFFLATFSWLVIASRLGMPAMLSVFATGAALCLLAYALRGHSRVAALGSGLLLGLSVYVFTLNMFYLVGVSGFILLVLLVRAEARRRETLYLVLLPAWLVAAPMVHHYYTHPHWISGNLATLYHVEVSSLWNVFGHAQRFAEVVLHAHRGADIRHGMVDAIEPRAILPSLLGAFFWVGLLVALCRARYSMLVMGWLVGMAPAVMVPGGDTRRYLLGAAFVLLIAAVGLAAAWGGVVRMLTARWGDRARCRVVTTGLVLFLAAFAAVNVYDLNQWPQSSAAEFLFTDELRWAAEYLDEVDQPMEVRWYSSRWSVRIEAVQWLAPDVFGLDGSVEFGGDGTIFSGGYPGDRTVYMLLPGYFDLLTELRRQYPNGRYVEAVAGERRQFIAFWVRP